MHFYIHTCIDVYVHFCIHTLESRLSEGIIVSACIAIQKLIFPSINTYIISLIFSRIRTHMHIHACTHRNPHIHTPSRTCERIHMCKLSNICMHCYMYLLSENLLWIFFFLPSKSNKLVYNLVAYHFISFLLSSSLHIYFLSFDLLLRVVFYSPLPASDEGR